MCVKHQQTTEEIHGAYFYSDEYYSDDEYSRDPNVDNLHRYYPNPDYSDEYYSDDEHSRDPDVDYADTTCYQPGISTRSSCASGAFHHDISTQPWQCQPNSSSGKSLVKQDPQNRSYPKPRKARKRHKMKHPKPSPLHHLLQEPCAHRPRRLSNCPTTPPIPPTMESSHEHKKMPNQGSPPTPNKAERAQPTETHPPTHHPPTLPPHHGELLPLVCRTRMSHTQPRLLMDAKCLESS
jgi:hypothetical protein